MGKLKNSDLIGHMEILHVEWVNDLNQFYHSENVIALFDGTQWVTRKHYGSGSSDGHNYPYQQGLFSDLWRSQTKMCWINIFMEDAQIHNTKRDRPVYTHSKMFGYTVKKCYKSIHLVISTMDKPMW